MDRVLLGMLTPSSNTVLEPTTQAMLAGLPEVSAHFARFRVTEIALSGAALAQFEPAPLLEAAALLADAEVDVIGWNGTSAAWLGFAADERLCTAIADRTGAAACTSVLALNEVLTATGRRRFALVTPYTDDVQAAIVANYRGAGYDLVAEAHLGIQRNFDFSEIEAGTVADLCRRVATAAPDAIAVVCTNMRGAALAQDLEQELGIPVYDSVATVVWKALRQAQVDPRRVQGWGRLFQEPIG